MDQWISQRQAAERYGVTPQTIRNWVRGTAVRTMKAGTFTFYHILDLDRLEAQRFVSRSN